MKQLIPKWTDRLSFRAAAFGLVLFLLSFFFFESSLFRQLIFSIPSEYLLDNSYDSYNYIPAEIEKAHLRDSDKEHIFILGSSSMRQGTLSAQKLQDDFDAALNRNVKVHKFAGSANHLFELFVIVEEAEGLKGSVVLGVNWKLFRKSDDKMAEQVSKLRLFSYPEESLEYFHSQGIPIQINRFQTAGFIQAFDSWIRHAAPTLAKKKLPYITYTGHSDERPRFSTPFNEKTFIKYRNRHRTRLHPGYWKYHEDCFKIFTDWISFARKRGLSVVLVETVSNPAAKELDAAVETHYKKKIKKISANLGVPYFDFRSELGLKPRDFADFIHLLPPSRHKYHNKFVSVISSSLKDQDQ